MTVDDIIDAMELKAGDRRDRIKAAIKDITSKGMLFWDKNKCLVVRKYAEKTRGVDRRLAEGCPEVVKGLTEGSPKKSKNAHHKPNKTKDLKSPNIYNKDTDTESDTEGEDKPQSNHPVICPECKGRKEIIIPSRPNFCESKRTCPTCRGKGKVWPEDVKIFEASKNK